MKRNSTRSHRSASRATMHWAIGSAVVLIAAFGFIALSKTFATPVVRTVALVHGAGDPQTRDEVHFVSGVAPTRTTTAVVLTDSNCTPDARGVSHCYNTVRLPDGHVITVRHDHDMRIVPCLAPGESIRLVPQTPM